MHTIFQLPYKQPPVPPVERSIRREQTIARVTRNPLADFAFRVCDKILSYRAVRDAQIKWERVQARANEANSTTGYDATTNELLVAIGYANEIEGGFKDKSYSPVLYERQTELLSEMPGGAKYDKLVNFGVSYGYVDDILAGRFSEVSFIGIDRSPLTKAFNETKFRRRSNLSFVAGDILSEFVQMPATNGILFHARTGTYLSRPVLSGIYKAARESGYRRLAAACHRPRPAPWTLALTTTTSMSQSNASPPSCRAPLSQLLIRMLIDSTVNPIRDRLLTQRLPKRQRLGHLGRVSSLISMARPRGFARQVGFRFSC